MLQGFVDIVEAMDTLLITAERRYEMKKSRSCRMKPQPRKRLRSPRTITRDVDPPMDLGIGPDETMIIGLWCQPHDHLLEESSGQVIRILTTSDRMDLSSEATTRILTTKDTMITKWGHHTSQTKTNPGIGEVTITIRDRLQRHDRIHLSQISADNPDQIHLTHQCLTGLEIATRATMYLTTRNFQLPTTVTSQTWFDLLHKTMKSMNYRNYALWTTKSPSSSTNQSKNSRLSFNFFYFATGETQKDSGFEIECMLDTGASSSIIICRTFGKICQTQHPITVKISTIQTRTHSGQVVPMIGFATLPTLPFNYDLGGQFFSL